MIVTEILNRTAGTVGVNTDYSERSYSRPVIRWHSLPSLEVVLNPTRPLKSHWNGTVRNQTGTNHNRFKRCRNVASRRACHSVLSTTWYG